MKTPVPCENTPSSLNVWCARFPRDTPHCGCAIVSTSIRVAEISPTFSQSVNYDFFTYLEKGPVKNGKNFQAWGTFGYQPGGNCAVSKQSLKPHICHQGCLGISPEKTTLTPDDPIHQFDSIPPNVQGYIRNQLKPPPAHADTLLPSQNMLVIDFVYSFSHPPVCKNPIDGHRFFSHELPDDDVGILTRLTVPPRTVLAILVKEGKQEWLDGSCLISLPGEPNSRYQRLR